MLFFQDGTGGFAQCATLTLPPPGQQPLALQGRWLYRIVTLPTEDKETQAARGESLTFPNSCR